MNNAELLKNARNKLVQLHKAVLDHERAIYEGINGPLNSGQFLGVLLENDDFAWLRKFSMLIVEIDELFAQKDGIAVEMIDANLNSLKDLLAMQDEDEVFRTKYMAALQQDIDAAELQSELKALLGLETSH